MGRRPRSADVLKSAVRNHIDCGTYHEFLSEGICACIENANSLRADHQVLLRQKRHAAAQFFYTTIFEEIGKALLLYDLVRSNGRKSGSYVKLCGFFYSHIHKFGYAYTVMHPGYGELIDALTLFKNSLIEYWPSGLETGEPPELARALANREWAIYVDYSEYDGWFQPSTSPYASYLAEDDLLNGRPPAVEDLDALLPMFNLARSESLFSASALEIAESEFGPLFVTAGRESELSKRILNFEKRLHRTDVHLSEETLHSNILRYPLYALLLEPKSVPAWPGR